MAGTAAPPSPGEIDLAAGNPGQWLAHCHNLYHMERGMMVVLSYIR
ncbi:MAG: multicopper oxidase domain-containing protein [Micromonosporaceae bacterium]